MARTPRGETRRRVLDFVRQRILSGEPPTVREVQEAMGFHAVQTAAEHLEALVAQGRLTKEPGGKARGLRLPGTARAAAGGAAPLFLVPLVGRVRAGALTEAIEAPEGFLPVRARRPREELFALRVRGDSMQGAAILDGDVAVVRRQPSARHGEIVVAMVAGEATLKRLVLRRGQAELHAENPAYPPIVPSPGELSILGKVVEIRRNLDSSRAPTS